MKSRGDKWARGVGIVAGLLVAGGAILAWRIPTGNGTLGTDLIIASHPTGELGVTPTGPFVSGTHMEPGAQSGAASGTLSVRNQTGKTMRVRLSGLPSTKDLDQLLWVEVDAAGLQLFRGPLGNLRSWTPGFFDLKPGQSKTLTVQSWLPSSVTRGYEGRIETVDLQLESIPVGA